MRNSNKSKGFWLFAEMTLGKDFREQYDSEKIAKHKS